MAPDLRICFVGDSLVNGTGDEMLLGWAGHLCAEARTRGQAVTYHNLGVRRETSEAIRKRCQAECRARFDAAADNRLVLSCGVNDAAIRNGRWRVPPARSVANVEAMVAEAITDCAVLVVGPPPVSDASHNERICQLSALYERALTEISVPFISLFEPLSSDQTYREDVAGNDGLHPRQTGYRAIARIVSASPLWWLHRAEASPSPSDRGESD